MPLCGRLFSEAKALFLFGLRAELRISSLLQGLDRKNREQDQGLEQQLLQQQRHG
jgi:hypothetical protein